VIAAAGFDKLVNGDKGVALRFESGDDFGGGLRLWFALTLL
jgi:hypothetical protein